MNVHQELAGGTHLLDALCYSTASYLQYYIVIRYSSSQLTRYVLIQHHLGMYCRFQWLNGPTPARSLRATLKVGVHSHSKVKL